MAMLVTKKTIEKMGSQMNNNAASKPSNFALRQMEKMGWKEGQGLGKDGSGITKSIAVSKKDDNAGLGVEKQKAEAETLADNWWHDAFSSNLKAFSCKLDKKKKKKRKDEDDENETAPTYEELFQATGGKRLGMRARADQPGKIRRTEGLQQQQSEVKEKQVITKPIDKDDDEEEIEIEEKKEKKKKNKKDKKRKSDE